MKVLLLSVGRVRGALAPAVEEYEGRIRHYYSFEAAEVKEEPARRGMEVERVRAEEGRRLLERVPPGFQLVALHETGRQWSSEELSRHLSDLALRGSAGTAFLIGGAYGLSDEVLRTARHQLSLSAFTLPHEMARLVLAEQLYRAGTIARGEPYHKGREG